MSTKRSVTGVGQDTWSSLSSQQQFCRRWQLVCGLGIPISLAGGKAMSFAIGFTTHLHQSWEIGLVLGAVVTGALVSFAQWLVLREKFSGATRWMLASSFSWTIGSAVAMVIGNAVFGVVNLTLFGTFNLALVWVVSGAIGGTIGGAIAGLMVGFAQWFVLRGKVSRSAQWIWASTLGWAAGNAAMMAIDLAAVGIVGLGMTWMLYGVLYGVVTSRTLTQWFSD